MDSNELFAQLRFLVRDELDDMGIRPALKSALDSAYVGGDPKTLRPGDSVAATDTKRIQAVYQHVFPDPGEPVVENPLSVDEWIQGTPRELPAGSFWQDSYELFPTFNQPETVTTASATSANQVRGIRLKIPIGYTVTHVCVEVVTATASALASFGIYSSDGGTKWLDSGTIDCSSNGVKTVDITDVKLPSGSCCYVFTVNDTTTTFRAAVMVSTITALMNAQKVQRFIAGNSATNGALPSSLGTLTGNSYGSLPFCKLQG